MHALVDDPGRRAELDVVVLAQRKDQSPQWVMQLWYNCHDLPEGQPPGEDLCDSVTFVFDDAVPSPTRFDNPLRIELKGLWADNRPTRAGTAPAAWRSTRSPQRPEDASAAQFWGGRGADAVLSVGSSSSTEPSTASSASTEPSPA